MNKIIEQIIGSLKAIASLVGAIATALAVAYTDNPVFPIVAVVATAIVTWVVPYIPGITPATDTLHGGEGVSGNSDEADQPLEWDES